MDKSIDLGKLQNDIDRAWQNCVKARNEFMSAHRAMIAAQTKSDAAAKKHLTAAQAVDKAKEVMLQAARTIAGS